MSSKMRSIDVSIDIEASREQVWAALTDPTEIPRWLAPAAKADLRIDGFIELSWGAEMTGRNTIKAFKPLQQLGLINNDGLREDYSINPVNGFTRLSLIHSGFRTDPEVDDQFDAISNGWRTFFRMCRHGLTRHAGKPYRNITLFSPLNLKRDLAWQEIIRPRSLTIDGLSELREGQHYEMTLATGIHLSGFVVHAALPGYFVLSAENLDDSLFALFNERNREGSFLTLTWILNGDAIRFEDRLRSQWTDWITSFVKLRMNGLQVA